MKLIKIIVVVAVLFTSGCSRDYFSDGGPINLDEAAKLGVSTMDYLRSRGELFDTLTTLIAGTGLEAAVNAQGVTFLAPQDYSINNYFKLIFPDPDKRPKTFSEIPQEEMDKIAEKIKNYIIPDEEILRNKLATTYSYVTTYGGSKARFNLVQDDYLGNINMGAKFIIFSLNTSAPGQKEQYKSVQIVTSDLRSTNGIVHVLNSDTHIFGFN